MYCKWHYVHKTSAHIRSSLWLPHQEFDRPLSWYYRREEFVRYSAECASHGMVVIPSSVMIDPGIQVILRLLLQQFERLQCWYY
jgi:hypothetical protein